MVCGKARCHLFQRNPTFRERSDDMESSIWIFLSFFFISVNTMLYLLRVCYEYVVVTYYYLTTCMLYHVQYIVS